MTRAFVHFLRRSIARKLTLTLVGFVAITTIAAGLYLNRALEAFAVDTLEVRLASIGRLLHDEARGLVRRDASPADFRAFTLRRSRPPASRVRVTKPVVQMQPIAHQMSEGDFTVRAPIRSPDEIGALGRALNGLAARLREKVHDLGHEQAKATAILDGMIEGVIAVDGRDIILLMNERARSMFGLDATRGEGKPFLEVIRNTELHEASREGRRADGGNASHHEHGPARPRERP